MKLSRFGKKITAEAGITQLMDDLGSALTDPGMKMLGGGNPAHVPEVQRHFRESMERILAAEGEFERFIGNYDTTQGHRLFVEALADLLRREFGWPITPANIALTLGSQTGFFLLFNMLAGEFDDGPRRKILLPLAPEYIGYADVGLADDLFVSNRPEIAHLDDHLFKYHVDFDAVDVTDEVGAICVSRPTNPTGNVLTDAEVEKLGALARDRGIPLILDNAYGAPFPHIIFTEVKPVWDENTIVCMSLSKLGLPSTRTGIIIAREEVIRAVSSMNGVMSLAPSGIGAALATDMVRSGEIIRISQEVIRPFYQERAECALEQLRGDLDGLDYHIHKPEGALFLWLWFRGLPITCQELYERLKRRGVLVVPGHYFFPGLEEPWRHRDECIRVTYSQDPEDVREGLRIIAEEAKRAHAGAATAT